MDLTIEQQRALALARVRLRMKQQAAPLPEPKNQSRMGMVDEALPEGQQPNIGRKGMMKPGDIVPTSLSSQGYQGMTQNIGDEIVAGMGAPLDVAVNKLTGEGPTSLGESYDQIRAFQNARDARTRDEHPYLSTAANLVGSVASTPKIIGKALEGGSTAEKVMRGFSTGGALGGVNAFGSGGESLKDRLNSVESGVVTGAGIGTAFPAAGALIGKTAKGAGNLLGNKAKAQFEMAPSFEDLQKTSSAAYGAGDAAADAIKLAPKEYQNLSFGFSDIAKKHGVGGALSEMTTANYPDSLKAINNWYKITLGVLKGERPAATYHELETMRQGMRAAVNSSFREGRMSPDGEMMSRMIDKVDDVMLRSPYAPARAAYRTMRKAEIIEDAFKIAENNAPQFSQAGLEKTLRDQFKRIANNKKLFSMFSKEEQAAILRVVRPGNMQMALRGLGALSPKGGVSTAFNILLNMQSLGIGLPFTGAAMGARAASTKMGLNNARAVSAMVRNGGTLPQLTAPQPRPGLPKWQAPFGLIPYFTAGQSGQ